MKNFLLIFTVFIVVASIGIFSFFYLGFSEKGEVEGMAYKISEEGTLFKTTEGQILVKVPPVQQKVLTDSEVFSFSIEDGFPELEEKMKASVESGDWVKVRYVKRHVKFSWRGKANVFAKEIISIPAPASPDPEVPNDNTETLNQDELI